MKNACSTLLIATTLLAGCSSAPRPEIKIASALQAFQESSTTFTEARRRIMQQRQENLSLMVERAESTRQEVERKQGTWRVLKDTERLELFDNLLSEAKGAAESQEALRRIRTAHEEAIKLAESKTLRDRNTLATMIKDLYVMGTEETSDQLEQYFQYLSAVAKQIASEQPGAAP